jgi:uncharacterized repeat protein (TIGR01451 family)
MFVHNEVGRTRIFILLGILVVLAAVIGLLVLPLPAQAREVPAGAVASPDNPQLSPPNARADCDRQRFDELRQAALGTRTDWATILTPESFAAHASARDEFIAYAARCSKKLGLKAREQIDSVLGAVSLPQRNSEQSPEQVPSKPVKPGFEKSGAELGHAPYAPLASTILTYLDDDPDPVIAGEELFYNVSVYNQGPDPATNVVVSGTLPATPTLTYLGDDLVAPQGCDVSSAPSISCSLGDLAVGEYRNFVIKTRISPDAVKSEADGTQVISFTLGTAVETTFVQDEADLRLSKFVEPATTIRAGDTFTYTVYVDNLGPSWSRGVIISDTLLSSAAVSIQSCAFSVSQGDGAIQQFTCTTGSLVSTQFGTDIGTFSTNFMSALTPSTQGRLRASFRLVANEDMDVTNTARVSANTTDPDMSNNFATTFTDVTAVSDLSLTKTASGEEQQVNQAGLMFNNAIFGQVFPTAPNYFASTRVTAGRRIQYMLTVQNNGPSPAESVVLSDRLPPGVQIYQGSLSVTKTPPGGSSTPITPAPCQTGTPGDPLDRMECTLGTLSSGDTAQVIFEVITDADIPAGTVLENDAVVTSNTFDDDTSDNSAFTQNTVLAAGDLSVSKSAVGEMVTSYDSNLNRFIVQDLANQVSAGMLLRYTIQVQNDGPSDSQNVTIQDALPAAPTPGPLTLDHVEGATCSPSTVDANTLFCSVGTLHAGERKTFHVYVKVDPAVPDNTILSNTATALQSGSNTVPPGAPPAIPGLEPTRALTWDPLTSDNSSNNTTTVFAVADVGVAKSVTPVKVDAGEQVKYTVTVTNFGPSLAEDVVVTDILPLEAAYEIDDAGCSLTGVAPDTLDCDLGTLQPDETRTIHIWAKVDEGTAPGTKLTNTADVSSTTNDLNTTNNTATADNYVETAPADLAIAKSGPATAGAGETITYTIDIINNGAGDAQNVVVLDYMHSALQSFSFSPSQGACNAGVEGDPLRPARCNLGNLAAAAVASIEVVARIRPTVVGDVNVFNDVQINADTPDPDMGNNIDSVLTKAQKYCGTLPTKPILLLPADGANSHQKQVELDWTDSECAIKYIVVIRRDAPDGELVIRKRGIKESYYKTDPLTAVHDYYWFVRPCNGFNCKPRSDTWYFSIRKP